MSWIGKLASWILLFVTPIAGLVFGWNFFVDGYDLALRLPRYFSGDLNWQSAIKPGLWVLLFGSASWLLLAWFFTLWGEPVEVAKSKTEKPKPGKNPLLPELNRLSHDDARVQLAADRLDDLIANFDMTDNQSAERTDQKITAARAAIEALKPHAHLKGYLKRFRAQLEQITGQIGYGGSEERRYGPTTEELAEARESLRSQGSGRARVDAEVARYRKDDPDFVPYYPADPKQVAALEKLDESERGGFSVRWGDDFQGEDAVESILSNHPQVISVRYEEGRWYSNGESGPAWYQFHVGCRKTDEAAIKADLEQRGRKQLGDAFSDINIS